MPGKKAKDEIEFAFGFKQICLLGLFTVLVLGITFFWGLEIGHKRAMRGEPSLLAFLEESADPHAEPVAIPSVLLDQPAGERFGGASPAAKLRTPAAPAPTASEPPGAGRAARRSIPRVKPRPAVKPATETPPKPGPAPVRAVETPAPRTGSSNRSIHYQVAALGVRKNAKALVDWLRSEGFPARIQPASDDGLFRVFVGPFRNDSDAASAKARLTKNGFHPLTRQF